ncbi:MAG: integrase [Acidovorax sp.]|nr:integrase [Acidovorax sp.]
MVYYFYDATADGNGEIPLGTDYTKAVARWKEITEHGTSEPATTGTLEEAFARWEAEVLPGYSSAETKRGYTKSLRMMRPALKEATWDQVDLPTIKAYLKKRTAKTQGNREMALLSVIWNWARGEGLVSLPWPAAGMERSKWKNKEKPRKMKVEDAVYAAIYAEAAQHIKDCMDLGSVTGMRLTDCIAVLMPRGAVLTLEASKTGKEAEWDLNLSQVLPGLVERRKALGAPHLMLLSLPNGRPVTQAALRYGWDTARAIAAQKAEEREDAELADAIKALYLRDMRKRAAQKAGSLEAAAELLQHSDKRLTERHYGGVRKLKPTG